MSFFAAKAAFYFLIQVSFVPAGFFYVKRAVNI
jgi:hypothetical protein